MATETLWCHAGNHEFTRTRVRGIKPIACPAHKAAPATETLWCQAGEHEWERPRAKGSKPHSCPAHTGNHHRRFKPRKADHEVGEGRTPFAPILGHLADASLALQAGGDVAGPLRRLAAAAELLALDPKVTGR